MEIKIIKKQVICIDLRVTDKLYRRNMDLSSVLTKAATVIRRLKKKRMVL